MVALDEFGKHGGTDESGGADEGDLHGFSLYEVLEKRYRLNDEPISGAKSSTP
jgi:hypothetical protein